MGLKQALKEGYKGSKENFKKILRWLCSYFLLAKESIPTEKWENKFQIHSKRLLTLKMYYL